MSHLIQTCVLQIDGQPPSESEVNAYLDFMQQTRDAQVLLQGVLLYGLARPPMQGEADRLSKVSDQWLAQLADRIKALGIEVKAYS